MDWSDLLLAGTTLAASFGGYYLAGRNEARRDQRARIGEQQRDDDQARNRRAEERHRIQLDALLALQEDCQRLARNTGQILHFDYLQAREGRYGLLPSDLDQESLDVRMSTKRNASRILDEGVRRAIDELTRVTADLVTTSRSFVELESTALESAVEAQMMRLYEAGERGTESIEDALRREIAWEPAIGREVVPGP